MTGGRDRRSSAAPKEHGSTDATRKAYAKENDVGEALLEAERPVSVAAAPCGWSGLTGWPAAWKGISPQLEMLCPGKKQTQALRRDPGT